MSFLGLSQQSTSRWVPLNTAVGSLTVLGCRRLGSGCQQVGFFRGAQRDNGFQASLQPVVVPAGLAETCLHPPWCFLACWRVTPILTSVTTGPPPMSVFLFSIIIRTLVVGLRPITLLQEGLILTDCIGQVPFSH